MGSFPVAAIRQCPATLPTQIASAPMLTFIFENYWLARLTGKSRLLAVVAICQLPAPHLPLERGQMPQQS
jgi:hypothetical protein